jgi:hypothetical protein
MSTIREILTAAEGLSAGDFLELRTQLDRLEEHIWKRESKAVSARLRKSRLTDVKIDEFVMKRRYRDRA